MAVLLVLGVALAALVDGVKGRDSQAPAAPGSAGERSAGAPAGGDAELLRGPDAPAPGALPGLLVAATAEDCRLRLVFLTGAALGEEGPETACRVWLSPAGNAAVVATGTVDGPLVRAIALARLGDPAELVAALGTARGEVAWSADGARLAWCRAAGDSVVRELGSGLESEVEGCSPRFGPDGALYTLSGGHVLRDGAPLLDGRAIARGFEDPGGEEAVKILGYDVAPDGLLAVSVLRYVHPSPELAVALWRGGQLEGRVDLPEEAVLAGVGGLVRFSPAGSELALGFEGGGRLAVAVKDAVVLYDAIGGGRVYSLPLDAAALGWAA